MAAAAGVATVTGWQARSCSQTQASISCRNCPNVCNASALPAAVRSSPGGVGFSGQGFRDCRAAELRFVGVGPRGARPCTRASAQGDESKATSQSGVKTKSILCMNCTGNGAVVCSQCKGKGLNSVDHFNGRYKAGQICWLCRGKKQMLCGECNGAGFIGGFLNTQDD